MPKVADNTLLRIKLSGSLEERAIEDPLNGLSARSKLDLILQAKANPQETIALDKNYFYEGKVIIVGARRQPLLTTDDMSDSH